MTKLIDQIPQQQYKKRLVFLDLAPGDVFRFDWQRPGALAPNEKMYIKVSANTYREFLDANRNLSWNTTLHQVILSTIESSHNQVIKLKELVFIPSEWEGFIE